MMRNFVRPGCRYFAGLGHPVDQFLTFVDPFFPQEAAPCLVRWPGYSSLHGGVYWRLPSQAVDACIAMIPEAGGDSTPPPPGQRPPSVLAEENRHLKDWFEGWFPQSVFISLGNGLSSVEAWFSTALDI